MSYILKEKVEDTSSIKKRYLISFIAFGLLIALMTTFLNIKFNTEDIYSELKDEAQIERKVKELYVQKYADTMRGILLSTKNNKNFINAIKDGDSASIVNLFSSQILYHHDIFQIRYLDQNGLEKVRIDRKRPSEPPFVVKKLQDKSNRYYFQVVKALSHNQVWLSKLDLNIEQGKIQKPLTPVMRIASPIFIKEQFSGILIINFFMEDFLKKLKESKAFDVYLIDKEGYYIIHKACQYSWSRYLGSEKSIKEEFKNYKEILTHKEYCKHTYSFSLSDYFNNGEDIKMLLKPKEHYFFSILLDYSVVFVIILIIIVLFSLFLSYLMAFYPMKIEKDRQSLNEKLIEYIDMVSENVITTVTDTQGKITDVSAYFCKISGYAKEELIGQSHNIIKHPNTPASLYQELWETISKGEVWRGEIENQHKSGSSYWVDTVIYPVFDAQEQITSYKSIRQNITDKKVIEKLSITDSMTGLYNRRYFNEVVEKEIRRAKREDHDFTFITFDVDNFKKYNDNYGHKAGDSVLITIGEVINESLKRASDYGFRLGGEEFGVICTGLDPKQAFEFAQKIKDAIYQENIEHLYNENYGRITISVGVVTYKGEKIKAFDSIYVEADNLLYRAKEKGRNRIEVVEEQG